MELTINQAVQTILDTLNLNCDIIPVDKWTVKIKAGHASGVLVRALDKAVTQGESGLLHCNIRIGINGVIQISDRK